MKHSHKILGFDKIVEQLKEHANTPQGKRRIEALEPSLEELKLRKQLKDTSRAKELIETHGIPPIPLMAMVEEHLGRTVAGELLNPEEIGEIGGFLVAVSRLKSYLDEARMEQNSLAFYSENLTELEELRSEIERTIRSGRIDDYASNTLRDVRRRIKVLEEKIKAKAEGILRNNKSYMADNFVVERNGRVCLPVKAAYKKKVVGSVIDQSATGATLFIEPREIERLKDEYDLSKIEEDSEERRILYMLADRIAGQELELRENIRVIVKLDFIFAKAKLSIQMGGIEPEINLNRYLHLEQARHPQLDPAECVPLDLEAGNGVRGIIITGPNTGGKTVAIKTIGLLSLMATAGLHVPCKRANIAMNSQILCDIGDGQDISDNLSTFSSHIRNIIRILEQTNEESLVILDELGSGTDPTEGMGIAIAILEQLRLKKCLFFATTHYPEVKEYAKRHQELLNARMAFDRQSLKPLYRLEIGKAGESCALYIAKHLGLPDEMLRMAAQESYGEGADEIIGELELTQEKMAITSGGPKIQKHVVIKKDQIHGDGFQRGDSVMVLPDRKLGIVAAPADRSGEVLVQVQKEKLLINHKRLKLQVPADQLYPEDYDFSIIFDSVEERKKRHQMGRKYQKDVTIESE